MHDRLKALMLYPESPLTSRLSIEDRAIAILMLLLQGKKEKAREVFFGDRTITKAQRPAIAKALNESYLFGQQLEWTNHGVNRTFRFWSAEEKKAYVAQATELVRCLHLLTPDVTLSFGAVLGLVRDGDLIPHDDDIDLAIALKPMKFTEAREVLHKHLAAHGYTCSGKNHTHFNVTKNGSRAIDVFIGFREGDHVSWFPSRRRSLIWNDVFPVDYVTFFGSELPVPNDLEKYLAVTYGADWRTPISVWSHPWDISEYRDFL